jgi:diguanylate cyclase (GGDEF)-like protein/PAS domain S-box-containing protein
VPEDRAACKKIFLQAIKSDAAYRREYRIERRDGEIIWVAERSQIVLDQQGQIEFISGVVFDISLQKEMELALKESELFWKTLLEGVGVGLMVIDRVNGRVTEVNPRATAMLGYSREQIIGQNRKKFFICPSNQEVAKKTLGWENRSEGSLVKADGSLLPVWQTSAPIKIGELTYILISFMDMTDQLQAEAALTQVNKDLQGAMSEVAKTNREISLISKMVELLQICQKPDEAYMIIGQYAQELFPGISGALYLSNNSENLLMMVSEWGVTLASEQVFSPLDCWALRQGRQHLCGSSPANAFNPKCHHLMANIPGSHLCVPLSAQGEIMGLLYLHKLHSLPGLGKTDQSEADFSKSQQKLARTLAENISLSLANLRLKESLRQQAIRDALTGLFNRRYLQETLEREIHRAKRKETSLGVIMLDVDHFKVFNDTHGHEAGDRLLAVLGRYLRSAIRMEDIACRYGGEEFTLILPDVTPDALLRRADAIRVGAGDMEVLYQGKPLGRVTISMGLSYFPQHGADGDSLLQAADEALYQAKRTGRDRVIMAGCQVQDSSFGEQAA